MNMTPKPDFDLLNMADFRDPVELLNDALGYLLESRGEAVAKASRAYDLIDQARELLEKICLDDIIGEKMRANGVRCPCVRHPENYRHGRWVGDTLWCLMPKEADTEPTAPDREPPASTRRINGKEAASGEKED